MVKSCFVACNTGIIFLMILNSPCVQLYPGLNNFLPYINFTYSKHTHHTQHLFSCRSDFFPLQYKIVYYIFCRFSLCFVFCTFFLRCCYLHLFYHCILLTPKVVFQSEIQGSQSVSK